MPVPQQPTPRRPGADERDGTGPQGQHPAAGEAPADQEPDPADEWEAYKSDILTVFFND